MLRILHLSDLHLHTNSSYDQNIVLKSLHNDIQDAPELNGKPDIVVFSGDMVNAGVSAAKFEQAIATCLDPILKRYGIGRDRLVVCPGNHDIDREVVRRERYIETGLSAQLDSRDAINTFVDLHKALDLSTAAPSPAFTRLSAFYQGVWSPLAPAGEPVNPFYTVRKYTAEGLSIGVCAFNTAWRCTGEADNVDRAKLILGERAVDMGIDALSDCDVKIAVFHHPTDWLTDEDRSSVEPRLQLGFDLLLFGHVHVAQPQSRQTGMGGAIYSQGGCLYETRRFFNGYSVVDLDFVSHKATIHVREYSDRTRRFDRAIGAIPPNGSVSFDIAGPGGRVGAGLSVILARVSPQVRRLGNDHVSLAAADSAKVDLERHFICPPLQKSRYSREYLDDDTEPDDMERVDVDSILALSENLLLIGRPEGGKTSIAHYCALRVSQGNGDQPRLPLIGKFSELKLGQNIIWRAVRSYANEISDASITSTQVLDLPTLVIVDDVDLNDDTRLALLKDARAEMPNARWVLIATQPSGNGNVLRRQAENLSDISTYEINELPRSAIRSLSAHWLEASADDDSTDKMFQQVMEHIQRAGLPRSGYIVSLILWSLKNRSAGELLNEAVLLQNIIDHLLDKMDYTGALRNEFDFTSKTAVLQDLANFFKEGDEVRPKNAVIERVLTFLNQKGLRYDADEIVAGLIKCGVLQRIDDEVSFRYRRFQEFFFAGHLRDTPAALATIIAGDSWLYYARELDIYTARFRHESQLLDVARDKLAEHGLSEPAATLDDLYSYISKGGNADAAKQRLQRMRKEPMTARKIDELRDRADQSISERRKQIAAKSKSTGGQGSPSLSRHLSALELYSQFIRNLEFADRSEKMAHLNHSLDIWVQNLRLFYEGFREVFEELRNDSTGGESTNEEEDKAVKAIVSAFESFAKTTVPTYVAQMAYHSLGSEKLADFLDDIAADDKNELFKRIVAAFVLVEIDPRRALARMRSKEWEEALAKRWVAHLVERRLYRYYLDRQLSADVRRDFESLVADLEVRISGPTSGGKGRIMQRLAKGTLKRSKGDSA